MPKHQATTLCSVKTKSVNKFKNQNTKLQQKEKKYEKMKRSQKLRKKPVKMISANVVEELYGAGWIRDDVQVNLCQFNAIF